jgi:hypothetical protein
MQSFTLYRDRDASIHSTHRQDASLHSRQADIQAFTTHSQGCKHSLPQTGCKLTLHTGRHTSIHYTQSGMQAFTPHIESDASIHYTQAGIQATQYNHFAMPLHHFATPHPYRYGPTQTFTRRKTVECSNFDNLKGLENGRNI